MNSSASEIHRSTTASLLRVPIRSRSRDQLQGYAFEQHEKRIEQIDIFWDFPETYKVSVPDYDSAQNRAVLQGFGKNGAHATDESPNKIWNKACPDYFFNLDETRLELNSLGQDSDGYTAEKISNYKIYSSINYLSHVNKCSIGIKLVFGSFSHEVDVVLNRYQAPVNVPVRTNRYLKDSLQEGIWYNANLNHYHKLKEKITGFNSLGQNWDGDGAEEIPAFAIEASLKFLDIVYQFLHGNEPTSVAPSPDGEIVLYWNFSNGYAEVNFDGTEAVTLCWKEEVEDMQLIEEDVKIFFEVDWIDKSLVWRKLYSFLCRGS